MKFITTAPDRRTLVKAIAAHTGMEPSYIGPPTFNYTVGTITIDREGYIDVPDEQAADLKAFLIAKGWMEPEPEPEQPQHPDWRTGERSDGSERHKPDLHALQQAVPAGQGHRHRLCAH